MRQGLKRRLRAAKVFAEARNMGKDDSAVRLNVALTEARLVVVMEMIAYFKATADDMKAST